VFVVVALVVFALSVAFFAMTFPALLFGDSSQVPVDFITGLLSFDGLMLAALAIFSTRVESGKSGNAIVAGISAMFVISAFSAMLALRGFDYSSGVALAPLGSALRVALTFTFSGLISWMILLYGVFASP